MAKCQLCFVEVSISLLRSIQFLAFSRLADIRPRSLFVSMKSLFLTEVSKVNTSPDTDKRNRFFYGAILITVDIKWVVWFKKTLKIPYWGIPVNKRQEGVFRVGPSSINAYKEHLSVAGGPNTWTAYWFHCVTLHFSCGGTAGELNLFCHRLQLMGGGLIVGHPVISQYLGNLSKLWSNGGSYDNDNIPMINA